MATQGVDAMCACGHPKNEHAGPTRRGVCLTCYHASDNYAPGTYCGHFRRPLRVPVPAT